MINATTSSSKPSPTGSPMPPVGAGTPPTQNPAPTPTIDSVAPPISTPSTPVVPPQVLPSHSAPVTHAARPLTAPHQDIAGLHKTLADKVGAQSSSFVPDSISSTTTGAGTPPVQPTIDTPVTPPPKRGGMGKVVIAIALFLVAVVGAGAAYYLNTQNQELRQRAFTSTTQSVKPCNFLEVKSINENTSCPSLTSSAQLCENPSGTNNVTSYKNTFTLKNPLDKKIKVTVKTSTNSCPEAYGVKTVQGEFGEVGACWRACFGDQDPNTPQFGSEQTREITLDPGQEQSVEISADTLISGQACGSMQLDLFMTRAVTVNDNGSDGEVLYDKATENVSQCNNLDTAGLLGWGFCQTGNQCAAPAQASCDAITVPDTITAGSSVEVTLAGKNVESFGLHYASSRQDYCPANTWTTLVANLTPVENATGKYTWNTTGLAPGKYFIAATSKFTDGTNCSANPSGSCGTAFKECKQCGKEITIVATPTVGSCDSITAPDSVTQGDKLTIKVNGTNLLSSKMFYSAEKADYCIAGGVNPWTEITAQGSGQFELDTTSLTPGSYYIAATAQLSSTKWCSANPSIAQCPSGFDSCTQCGKKVTITAKPPTPPTGAMCMNLCGVASATSSLLDFASCPAAGGKVGTPVINGYINFKCEYRGQISKAVISVSKDGGSYQEIPTSFQSNGYYAASYKILEQGTYAARCDITPQASGTYTPPTTELPPTGTQAACPTTSEYACVADLVACNDIGAAEFISLPNTGQVVPKYSCTNPAQICCKKDPAKVPNPEKPLCANIPNPGKGSPRCTLQSLCTSGRIETNATCSTQGTVCCVPNQ